MQQEIFHESVLPNGVRAITAEFPWLPPDGPVAFGVCVEVGSAHESENNIGAAHLFEHLCLSLPFAHHETGCLKDAVAAMGYNDPNGATFRRWTFFGIFKNGAIGGFKVLRKDLPMVFSHFAHALLAPAFDDATFIAQQKCVMREIRMKPPYELDEYRAYSTIWQAPWLNAPISGNVENVCSLTPEILQDFHTQHYTGDKITLIACGAVNHNDLLALTEKYYGDLPIGKTFDLLIGPYRSGDYHFIDRPASKDPNKRGETSFQLRFPYSSPHLRDDLLHLGLAILLGRQLFDNIRQKDGDTYQIDVFPQAVMPPQANELVIGFTCDVRKALPLVQKIFSIIRDFIDLKDKTGFNRQLKEAKKQYAQSLQMEEMTSSSRVGALFHSLATYRRIVPDSERMETVHTISIQDLAKTAGQIFTGPMSMYSYHDPWGCTQRPSLPQVQDSRASGLKL